MLKGGDLLRRIAGSVLVSCLKFYEPHIMEVFINEKEKDFTDVTSSSHISWIR